MVTARDTVDGDGDGDGDNGESEQVIAINLKLVRLELIHLIAECRCSVTR